MRSPVIAFSILAAAAVSPSLVSGAPTSPQLDKALGHHNALAQNNAITRTQDISTHQVREGPAREITGLVGGITTAGPSPHATPAPPSQHDRNENFKKAKAQLNQPSTPQMKVAAPPASAPPTAAKMSKRAGDNNTAGGNAYSGAAQDSSGGDVENDSQDGDVTNADGSNAAGGAGSSFSGFAFGGNGNGHGPGGNAYTGATGASRGGNVVNTSEGNGAGGDGGDTMDNTAANTAGGGGESESGTAQGGGARGPTMPASVQRRAGDNGTAGGNAYSGATSDVSGGSVVNAADNRGTITNNGGSKSEPSVI
ncbi:hypothetical protein C8T65DRAFT_626014 [Cerioporus squamosus]|nr:hypothetical protein C8T65DRAFT_626014 [Cerioporus squamosus]